MSRGLSPAERDGDLAPTFSVLLASTHLYTAAITTDKLSETERVRFTHTYYGLWKLSLSPVSTLRDTLVATNLRELLYLYEIGHQWVNTYMESENNAQPNMLRERWQPLIKVLFLVFMEKTQCILAQCPSYPLRLFSIFDQLQEEVI